MNTWAVFTVDKLIVNTAGEEQGYKTPDHSVDVERTNKVFLQFQTPESPPHSPLWNSIKSYMNCWRAPTLPERTSKRRSGRSSERKTSSRRSIVPIRFTGQATAFRMDVVEALYSDSNFRNRVGDFV